ncbi:MAG TPA: LysR family transcriptional regulator [Xanthobacteraceae bacterium]|jgi:DNA-binding transcriptional LysR family regulator
MRFEERIGRRLKLRDLNIFLVVAKERSMSRAAVALAMSQPAVSKSIADIEHTLRAPVFDRTPFGVEPTPYGRALMNRANAVFDELHHSVKDIEALLDPTTGEARIGATPPLAAAVVPAIMDKLSSQYPGISFQVIDGDVARLLPQLRDRSLDLVIGRSVSPVSDDDIESQVLFDDRLLVVTGARNKWNGRTRIPLRDLISEPWVLPSYDGVSGTLISETFRAAKVNPPKPKVTSSSFPATHFLLATGRFLCLLPETTIRLSAKHVRLKVLPVDLPHLRRSIFMITLKNRTLSPATKLFIDCAREMVTPFAKGAAPEG